MKDTFDVAARLRRAEARTPKLEQALDESVGGRTEATLHDMFYSISCELTRQIDLKIQGKFQYLCGESPSRFENLAIVTEEFLETVRVVNDKESDERLKEELTQLAAVCISWLKFLG